MSHLFREKRRGKTLWNDRLHFVGSRVGVLRRQSRIRKEPVVPYVLTNQESCFEDVLIPITSRPGP
jgi:hypothetical protein